MIGAESTSTSAPSGRSACASDPTPSRSLRRVCVLLLPHRPLPEPSRPRSESWRGRSAARPTGTMAAIGAPWRVTDGRVSAPLRLGEQRRQLAAGVLDAFAILA